MQPNWGPHILFQFQQAFLGLVNSGRVSSCSFLLHLILVTPHFPLQILSCPSKTLLPPVLSRLLSVFHIAFEYLYHNTNSEKPASPISVFVVSFSKAVVLGLWDHDCLICDLSLFKQHRNNLHGHVPPILLIICSWSSPVKKSMPPYPNQPTKNTGLSA